MGAEQDELRSKEEELLALKEKQLIAEEKRKRRAEDDTTFGAVDMDSTVDPSDIRPDSGVGLGHDYVDLSALQLHKCAFECFFLGLLLFASCIFASVCFKWLRCFSEPVRLSH